MRINWRTAAVAAGTGFVLSLLSGLIGGVTFGAVLFRAVIAAIIVGAGGVGIERVLRSYLPELFSVVAGAGSAEAPQSGKVEIVLEEDEYSPQGEAPGREAGEAATEDLPPADEDDETTSDAGAEGENRPVSLDHLEDSLVEEVTEELGGEEPDSLREGSEEFGFTPADTGDEAEGAPEGPSVSGWDEDDDTDLSELDSLPDLESLGDFSGNVGTGGSAPRSSSTGRSGGGSAEQDPSVMAKALQTMLNRDERRE